MSEKSGIFELIKILTTNRKCNMSKLSKTNGRAILEFNEYERNRILNNFQNVFSYKSNLFSETLKNGYFEIMRKISENENYYDYAECYMIYSIISSTYRDGFRSDVLIGKLAKELLDVENFKSDLSKELERCLLLR